MNFTLTYLTRLILYRTFCRSQTASVLDVALVRAFRLVPCAPSGVVRPKQWLRDTRVGVAPSVSSVTNSGQWNAGADRNWKMRMV